MVQKPSEMLIEAPENLHIREHYYELQGDVVKYCAVGYIVKSDKIQSLSINKFYAICRLIDPKFDKNTTFNCPQCNDFHEWTLHALITHLNDEHEWKFKQIGKYLQSVGL